MRRRIRQWPPVLLVMLFLASVALPGLFGPPRAAAAEESAVDNFGACLANEKVGDILVLVDTSSSLQSTDATGARVAAGKYLLTQLASFAEQAEVELSVMVSGFANRYEPGSQRWDPLNPSSIDRVLSEVDDFQTRNTGFGTDYWLGLDGARRDLAARAEQRPTDCQAIVFFSDGALDIDRAPDEDNNPIDRPYDPDNPLRNDTDRNDARERAAADMCRDGGLADQIRAQHIVILAVGLTPDEAGARDFDLMRRVATGTGDAGDCGSIQSPRPGEFALVSDIDDLLFEFDKYSQPGREPVVYEGKVCQGQVCPDGAHSFVLDDSITKIRLLGQANIDGAQIFLVAPNGSDLEVQHSLTTTTAELDGVQVSYQWPSERSVALTAEHNNADAWSGQWQIVFVDPTSTSPDGVSRTSIHLFGDLFPAWPNAATTELRAGETAEVTLGLERSDGTTVDPTALLGEVTLDASLVIGGQERDLAVGLTKDTIATPFTLDASDISPGNYTMRLRLNVTTAATQSPDGQAIPGTALAPQVVDVPVTVLRPLGYPEVGHVVNFGSAVGELNLSAALPVTGPGCVWVTPQQATPQTGPESITTVQISADQSSAETCQVVGEGESDEIQVTLASDQSGTGGLTGTFTVHIAPVDALDRAETVEVEYRADVSRPLNTRNFIVTLILAAILGPGIPLGLLWLTKRANAKIPDRPLLFQEIPVQITSEVLREGRPISFVDGDLRQMAQIPTGGARTLSLGGVELQARTGASPFGQGNVVVSAPPRWVATVDGAGATATMPLAVHNNWVLLHDPSGPADQASVLLLVAGEAPPARRAELVADVARKAPAMLSQIRASATEAGVATPPPAGGATPFGGGPTGPANPFTDGGSNPWGGPSAPPTGGPGPSSSPFG